MFWLGRCLSSAGRHIRTTLVAGVLIIIPVAVTFVVLKFVFDFFDPLLEPLLDRFIDYTPGMGIASLVIVIYLAGLITTHFIGRRVIKFGHDIVELIPLVRSIYRTARQATEVFSNVSSNGKFGSVVLVDFPGYGIKSIGLVTARMKDQDGKTLLAVFVPTTPFPTSGFLVFLHEDQVTYTDLPVDDAMKLIISAGIMAPEKIGSGPGPFTSSGQAPFWTAPPPPGFPFAPQGTPRPGERTGYDHDSENRTSNQ